MSTFECGDCGRDDHTSVSAMMQCPCDRYDTNGYPVHVKGADWLP